MKLFAIILTYNEEQNIQACLESLHFSDHIVVFDSYSTDATVQLAKQSGAEVIQRVFDDYAGQRNAALKYVEGRADWVLFVDADERVSPELALEVQTVIQRTKYAAWRVPRLNYIFGKLTKGAGWYPDYQTRLLRLGAAHYDPARRVHELVNVDGAEGTLNEHFIHLNYENLSQFHTKQQRYSAYDAQIMHQQGIQPKFQNFILQPLRQFWWRFVSLRGYQDGWHGLRLSLLMAWYELRKYIYLKGLWQKSL